MNTYSAEVGIIGAGIAGLVACLELLNKGKSVILVDRDNEKELGGLAKWAFGGMFFVNTKHQQKNGIKDSIDQALKDWYSYAQFEENEYWGREWANQYVHLCTDYGYHWLQSQGLDFFRVLNWAERGLKVKGNSVPRFHMVWGTGWELVELMKKKIANHPNRSKLQILCNHRVEELVVSQGKVVGCIGKNKTAEFELKTDNTIVATGGINGNIEKVKANWDPVLGKPPEIILNGAHKYALGDLHKATSNINGSVVNLEKQWNYAAGIRHYKPRKIDHGLSLVPCKSALWLDAKGKRIGPTPLVTGFDTRYLVERIVDQEHKYSWQILNRKIALKEFAISGSEHNQAIKNKKFFQFVKNVLFGNKSLVNLVSEKCEDILVADTIESLVHKMNTLENPTEVKLNLVQQAVEEYDAQLNMGAPYQDEQIQLIQKAREWKGDKARTCKLQKISDPKAGPFMAIRNFILSRKSLGGIQTNLSCSVLTKADLTGKQETIPGLYAIGEAAGFGGGGIHGKRSLEGTFLGACVITARICVEKMD